MQRLHFLLEVEYGFDLLRIFHLRLYIGGLAVVAFWRSPHGPLGSGPPRADYSQRRKRKEKGEKGKRRKKERKKEGERKEKEKKRREEREEDLRPIWAGYSVFRLFTSL